MKLIDREEAINNIRYLWDWNTVGGISSTTVLKQTISDIRNTPLVDAVPVVRCKDCKCAKLLFTWDDGTEWYLCQIHSLVDMPSNWFCKDGERKENGTD